MSHLKHFAVVNFKVFKELTQFELAPITIITGKNNSGKSSLIKSMLLLRNNPVVKPNFINRYNFEQWKFDSSELKLGSSDKFLNYETESKKIEFELSVNNPMLPNGIISLTYNLEDKDESFVIRAFEILINNEVIVKFDYNLLDLDYSEVSWEQFIKIDFQYFINRIRENIPNKSEIKPSEIVEKIGLYRRFDQKQREQELGMKLLDLLESNQVVIGLDNPMYPQDPQGNNWVGGGKIDISKEDLTLIQSHLFGSYKNGILFPSAINYLGCIASFNLALQNIKNEILEVFSQDEYLLKKYEKACTHRSGGKLFLEPILHSFFEYILVFFRNLFDELQNEFSDITYLPSIRARNERIYLVSKEGYAIQAIDEKSWNELGLEKEKEKNGEFYKFYQKALKDFEIGEEIKIKTYERTATQITITRNGREVILSDLGFGYAQLIPIIFTILDKARKYWPFWESQNEADKSSIPCPRILIEEPESNLHPDFQSKLADLFVEASKKFGIQFIIETHSEYFIRRLQYLTAREDININPEDISIYYFNNPEKVPAGEKQITKIEIGSDGSLSREFGSGFLDEADNLAMNLFILSKHQKN